MLKPIFIEARDLPDAWFQCIWEILDHGTKYTIDRGSYQGQQRLEFDYVTVHIKYPGTRPLLPDIPPALGIPNPVAEGYLEEYIPYLMTSDKKPGEDYTYGERLAGWQGVNQIEEVIKMYKTQGYPSSYGDCYSNRCCVG
jgi:thymidylate synthase